MAAAHSIIPLNRYSDTTQGAGSTASISVDVERVCQSDRSVRLRLRSDGAWAITPGERHSKYM